MSDFRRDYTPDNNPMVGIVYSIGIIIVLFLIVTGLVVTL